MSAELRFVGAVESALVDEGEAPKQPDEGAPPATLRIEPEYAACCEGLRAGEQVLVLTWLDRADRAVQAVHPRGDPSRPLSGVFATRSPARPNPIGLHRAEVVSISGDAGDPRRVRLDALEALDGTPSSTSSRCWRPIPRSAELLSGFRHSWPGSQRNGSKSRSNSTEERQMSTATVVIVIVAVVVILVLLGLAASRRRRRRQVDRAQGRALHDDVDRHRSHAERARGEADLAEERAKRTAAEAELEERRAVDREREVDESR